MPPIRNSFPVPVRQASRYTVGMKVWSIGDCVRPGPYTLRTRYSRSILLMGPARRLLFIVDRSIGPGPLNLVVSRPDRFLPGETYHLASELEAPRFDSALPLFDTQLQSRLVRVLHTNLPLLAPPESLISLVTPNRTLPRLQAARDALFRRAIQLITRGERAEGIRLVRGCGEGLTPSGDDFLCGWMLACRLRGQPAQARKILPHALGRNKVSNAFLTLSAQGRVHLPMQRLLQAPSAARVRAVCAFGHNSGADLLCGLLWAFAGLPDAIG